ncbi:N-6 DNA Methylase [Anaerobranca californiensis DSM 14826]|uniref:site-specific DNA-methyltransferase (adenine-specific) n=1 Tax=Anaerobranca californiensis DSM 14826 TaxID=1120989 RepID=A0A1M6M5Y7_9FIRM|nr:TaqI-like C-terminal specificity domain-containing protein [Anaerobranca californiensis]SHJ78891.1 N-6 DNA Methylase [Anaerobranca californiensis DSM 14826]
MVEDVLSYFPHIPKILDPACGSGNFLLKCYKRLVEKYGEENKEGILANLWGWDIDKIAISLCKINLLLLTGDDSENFKVTNFFEIITKGNIQGEFDIIIGNPPWGYKFTIEERKDLGFVKKNPESSAIFTLKGMDLLKNNGYLSFCLPKALLNVKSHKLFRKKILTEHTLIKIKDLGKAFDGVLSSSIVLTVQKRKSKQGDNINIVSKWGSFTVNKGKVEKNPYWNINFIKGPLTLDILEKMRRIPSTTLKGSIFALGIVTGNNKNFIIPKDKIKDEEKDSLQKIIKGKDILKFKINPQLDYILFQREKFQQIAPIEYYKTPEKLVYRFISSKLIFAYDDTGALTLNSANILIPKESLNIKYILALLNSTAMQFYFENTFSSIKILRYHLEDLPIPIVDPLKEREVVDLVNLVIQAEKEDTLNSLYHELDQKVYKLFNLNRKEVDFLKRCL